MNLKNLLFISLFIFASTFLHSQTVAENFTLENTNIKVIFSAKEGRLIMLENKLTGWKIQDNKELAGSFKMAVPLPGRRDHLIDGTNIRPTTIKLSEDKNQLTIIWNKISSENKDQLNIKFTGIIKLKSDGLEFSAEVENNSDFTIETIYWPVINDLKHPQGTKKIEWLKNNYYGAKSTTTISPEFKSTQGYWGVDYPTQTHRTQWFLDSPFGLINSENQGLYVGYHDNTDEHLVQYTFVLKPGFEDSYSMNTGNIPKSETVNGEKVHIEFYCVHFPFINKGENAKLKPIVLNTYTGSWHKGVSNFKHWFKDQYSPYPLPSWAKEVHSWQQLHIFSSEDRPVCKYTELVDYARSCAKHGVKVIQLTGWTKGGQDRGYPSHDTEEGLGTKEELAKAIKDCQKLGVKVILFNKYTWADQSLENYTKTFYPLTIKDPYGNPYPAGGYRYQTATQLAGINTRQLVPLCPFSKEWIKIAGEEFKKSIELGADGMLYDEDQWHGKAFYCFDPSHGHHVPANVYNGEKLLENHFKEITKELNPDYVLAGEGCRPNQFQTYNFSYFRINTGQTHLWRYLNPYSPMIIAVIGYNDRNTLNTALMCNYIISYESKNFKGKLEDFPETLAYGKLIDKLRTKYKEHLWDAEYQDIIGGDVTVNGKAHDKYSVFINRTTGKRAIVVANFSEEVINNVIVKFDTKAGNSVLVSPENLTEVNYNDNFTIPAKSVKVIIEK